MVPEKSHVADADRPASPASLNLEHDPSRSRLCRLVRRRSLADRCHQGEAGRLEVDQAFIHLPRNLQPQSHRAQPWFPSTVCAPCRQDAASPCHHRSHIPTTHRLYVNIPLPCPDLVPHTLPSTTPARHLAHRATAYLHRLGLHHHHLSLHLHSKRRWMCVLTRDYAGWRRPSAQSRRCQQPWLGSSRPSTRYYAHKTRWQLS